MRTRDTPLAKAPGTVQMGTKGRCGACASRDRRRGCAGLKKPQETTDRTDNLVIGLQAFMAARHLRGNKPELAKPIVYAPSEVSVLKHLAPLPPPIEYRAPLSQAA